jgi:hypothetical protein
MYIMEPRQPVNSAESTWLPMVMEDPALFHTVLCTSAMYIDFLHRSEDSVPPQKHMLEAIKLINSRLEQPDAVECVSDSSIAAVAFMAKAEVIAPPYAGAIANLTILVCAGELRKLDHPYEWFEGNYQPSRGNDDIECSFKRKDL